jgi:NAD(P)-dependent dehydrogenase (short-subunit alcohol dehydrogenase family)
MSYFVTGATGLIGRHLLPRLAARGEPVYVLVREACNARLERALAGCGVHRQAIVPLVGDLRRAGLGLTAEERARLRGNIRHFIHLAALYDLAADEAALQYSNVEGTRNALQLAEELQAQCLHFASSIAVAGRYPGCFTERMFSEAVGLDHPYFRTKHDAEALVRANVRVPWRIYRPAMVVGDSRTGEMDKIDGPYYLFKPIQKLRDLVPRWLPLPPVQGGHVSLVPVDFVAAALDHLVHLPDQNGRCFHLTGRDHRLGEILNIFAGAAHAPIMRSTAGLSWIKLLAPPLPAGALQPLRHVVEDVLADLGVPRSAVGLLQHPTTFDAAEADRLLEQAGISVPELPTYAWRLWDYWERELDPDAHPQQRLREAAAGKTILITGGSSGIGRATALRLAAAGAQILIVARDQPRLEAVRAEISALGAAVRTYVCDLTDAGAAERFISQLLADHPRIDVLINNAGRSIRRSVQQAYDRLHDYERLMRINYHAAVHLTLRILPAMVRQGDGHVINISSIGVLSNAPRFSAYNASKAALEAFSRTAAAEFKSQNIRFTVINMPLVRTPMVAPTRLYDQLTLLEPDEAASLICDAIVRRPARLTSFAGLLAMATELLAPAIGRSIMSESFRLFPDSDSSVRSETALARRECNVSASNAQSAQSAQSAHSSMSPATPEMRLLAALLHGVHL